MQLLEFKAFPFTICKLYPFNKANSTEESSTHTLEISQPPCSDFLPSQNFKLMGSCISKFGAKRTKFKKECSKGCIHVHDKLVIAQASVTATPHSLQKRVSPLPSAASNISFSSFSGPTGTGFSVTLSPPPSSSSCSSSLSMTKDRTFSSEFLRACVKQNPHIIGRNSIEESIESSRIFSKTNPKRYDLVPSPEKPPVAAVQQEFEERRGGSTPKKRIRTNSPTITRQKSFRKEPELESDMYHVSSRTLRSPSPSRTFSAEPCRTLKSPSPSRRHIGGHSFKDSNMMTKMENYSKRGVISSSSMLNPQSPRFKKQSFRASPVNQLHRLNTVRDKSNPQVSSRMEECEAVDEEKQHEDAEIMADDINNPQIALDCFIFM